MKPEVYRPSRIGADSARSLLPGITIVIPTHNRYDKLRALLESLRQHFAAQVHSVVIVDDSTEPVDLTPEFPELPMRQLIMNRRVFTSRAKNIGWTSTNTPYVYFIDDDNVITEETVEPVFAVISRSASIGALMPAVLYKSRPELVWVYATPFVNARLKLGLVGRNAPRNPSLENRLLKTDALPNASLVRRQALEDVGGFDERLVVNSSLDFSLRLKARNWQVFAHTGAFIYHDVEPPGRLGWWAIHGSADPQRVRYEIRDWFLIMKSLRGRERLFMVRAIIWSARFVLPNLLAYILRSRSRVRLVKSLVTGYLEGLRLTSEG